jgi:hypothetical protein
MATPDQKDPQVDTMKGVDGKTSGRCDTQLSTEHRISMSSDVLARAPPKAKRIREAVDGVEVAHIG